MRQGNLGTRIAALVCALALLAAACGEESAHDVDAAGDPEATPTAAAEPTEPPAEPLTSTVTDLEDPEDAFREYEDFIEATDPLPPGGGELIDCSEVPDLEGTVEGPGLGARQNVDDDVMGVVITYGQERPEIFGGLFIDRARGGTVVLAFTDDPAPHLERLLARAPSEDDLPMVSPRQPIQDDRSLGERDDIAIDVIQVDFTEAQLRATQNAIGQLSPEYGIRGIGSGGRKNRVEITIIDPPEGALDELADLLPTAAVCISVQRTPEAPTGPLMIIPDLEVEDPLVNCGVGPPVPYSELLAVRPIAEVDHPAVDALTTELTNPGVEPLPDGDWIVHFIGDDNATFRTQQGGYAFFERRGDRWFITGWGGGNRECEVEVALPDGLGVVGVRLDPSALPDPASSEITLLVTERGCASGREMGDALLGPQVVETDDAVVVAFAVIPVTGGVATCPGNPSTTVTIQLDRPLGDRVLLDGLTIPPRPVEDTGPD